MVVHKISDHARVRITQRGISIELVEFILIHGKTVRSNNAWIHHCRHKKFTPHVLRDLSPAFKEKLAKHPYVVTNGERLITVGYGYKRIKTAYQPRKRRGRRRF